MAAPARTVLSDASTLRRVPVRWLDLEPGDLLVKADGSVAGRVTRVETREIRGKRNLRKFRVTVDGVIG